VHCSTAAASHHEKFTNSSWFALTCAKFLVACLPDQRRECSVTFHKLAILASGVTRGLSLGMKTSLKGAQCPW